MVLGITFSPTEDLKAWAGETGLTTDLLYDTDRSVEHSAANDGETNRTYLIIMLR